MSREAFYLARMAILAAMAVGIMWSISWSEAAKYDAQRPQVDCGEDA